MNDSSGRSKKANVRIVKPLASYNSAGNGNNGMRYVTDRVFVSLNTPATAISIDAATAEESPNSFATASPPIEMTPPISSGGIAYTNSSDLPPDPVPPRG